MAKKRTTKKKVTGKKPVRKKTPKKLTASTLSAKLQETIKKDFPHRVLTKEMMVGRLAELSEFTSITVEAAALGPRENTTWGDDANLNGLCAISNEVARELVKHQTNRKLSGLVTIPDDVAKVLSTHQGKGLHLNGLRSLTDSAADSLKDFKGGGWL